MGSHNSSRSCYVKFVATALLGLTLISLTAQPAESRPWRRGGWARGWGGYRAYRMPYRNYAPVYPRYGYRAPIPRSYYNTNSFYRYGVPYQYGYGGSGGYFGPIAPGYGYSTGFPPLM